MATLTTEWQNLGSSGWTGISNANLTLQGRYTSQSTTSNNTTCEFRVVTGGSTSWRTYTGSAAYKGSYSDPFNIATAPTYVTPGSVIMPITKTIGHNNDGSKTISLGASGNIALNDGKHYFDIGEVSITLPRINRVSPITGFTGSDVEGNISATYTQYVSSYTQKLRIAINGGATLQTFDNYASGSNVTLGSSAVTAIQNYMNTNSTKQVTLAAVIETWNGSTKIGESDAKTNVFTFSNANPTISNTETETDANVITYYGTSASTIIQSVSKVQCQITATAQKGASIYSVSIVHNGVTYPTTLSSGKYVATIPMSANSFVINVADNRGNTSTKTVTKTMITYSPVDFTAFTIKRVNSTSSNIRFDIEARYYQRTFGSTANAPKIYYKKDNGSYVQIPSTQYTIDSTNNKVTITNYVVNDLLVYTSPAQFTLYIEDKLTNDTDGGTKGYVTKGISTFEAGEHDLQVNGDLIVADTNRQNPVNILTRIGELATGIGNVVRSYSNTNGDYIVFEDGTLICCKSVTKSVAMTSSWGNMYEGEMELGDWAHPFYAKPYVFYANVSSTGAIIEARGGTQISTSSAGSIYLCRPNSLTNNVTIDVVGIGRWKA